MLRRVMARDLGWIHRGLTGTEQVRGGSRGSGEERQRFEILMARRRCTGARKSLVVWEDLDRGKVEAADWGGAENKGEWRRPKGNDGTSLLEFRVGQIYISQED